MKNESETSQYSCIPTICRLFQIKILRFTRLSRTNLSHLVTAGIITIGVTVSVILDVISRKTVDFNRDFLTEKNI